jgi:hypothetical protein
MKQRAYGRRQLYLCHSTKCVCLSVCLSACFIRSGNSIASQNGNVGWCVMIIGLSLWTLHSQVMTASDLGGGGGGYNGLSSVLKWAGLRSCVIVCNNGRKLEGLVVWQRYLVMGRFAVRVECCRCCDMAGNWNSVRWSAVQVFIDRKGRCLWRSFGALLMYGRFPL